MSENIFFDVRKLKYLGNNVIIGKTTRIRYPELVELHDNTIIDDYVYISTGLIANKNSIIEPGCVLMGGKDNQIVLESYTAIAPNCTLLCSTNDFSESLPGPFIESIHQKFYAGCITIKQYVIIGANTTILPNVTIGEGARIGANSLVKTDVTPWGIYAGSPARKLSDVNKEAVLEKMNNYKRTSNDI